CNNPAIKPPRHGPTTYTQKEPQSCSIQAGPKLRAGLRLAPEKLPSTPTMTEATPTTARGVHRIRFLLLSISKITNARENVPMISAPVAAQVDTPLPGRFKASCTDCPKPPELAAPAHAPTMPPPSWAMTYPNRSCSCILPSAKKPRDTAGFR